MPLKRPKSALQFAIEKKVFTLPGAQEADEEDDSECK